jgi:hypothetical protein
MALGIEGLLDDQREGAAAVGAADEQAALARLWSCWVVASR